jgi:hypothetical protein
LFNKIKEGFEYEHITWIKEQITNNTYDIQDIYGCFIPDAYRSSKVSDS